MGQIRPGEAQRGEEPPSFGELRTLEVGELQAELVRAYLAGYWQAVEDFGAHARRAGHSRWRDRQQEGNT